MDAVNRTSVTAWITKRDTDALFTITDSFKTFGSVNANDSAYTGANGFKITVDPAATNGHACKIDLICKDATDSTWMSGYDVAVGTAVLNYTGMIVRDSPPGGNSNGILDPGESVTLITTVANSGIGNAYNARGVFISGDVRLSVTDSMGGYGMIPHDSSRNNAADRYGVTADPGIPPGTPVPCTLRLYADQGYSVTRPFTIRVGMPATPGALLADHDTGYCKLTVSCIGSIGYDTPNSPQQGSGFCYPKSATTALYYGGMMAGNGPGYIVDRHYGVPATAINTDWAIDESLRFYPPTRGDEMIMGSYTDAGHTSPQGLKASQTSFMSAAPGYDDFVVMVFDYQNTGSSPINGLYSGMIGDFDVGTSTNDDASTDAGRRAAYIWEDGVNNPTAGFKLLYPTTASNLTVIDHDIYVYPDTSMSEGAKYAFMNGALSFPQSNRVYDWSVCCAAGPFDLAPGAGQRVAYAVVGGSDEPSFLEHCDSAQSWYDHNVGIADKPAALLPAGLAFRLAPNPVSRSARIAYNLPNAGRLSVKVFDISGREQAVLLDEQCPAGAGAIDWTPRALARGVYFVRAAYAGDTRVEKVMLIR